MRKKPDGTWKTGDFNYLRVLAGYYLYGDMKKNKAVRLIVSGGRGIYKKIPGVPAVATIMKQELIWLTKLVGKNSDKIIVVSNNYHLPRIKVMVDILPELKKLKKNLTLISAEKISVQHDKKLKNKIEKMAHDLRMRKFILFEKEGIKALKSGQYKFR